MDFPPSALAAFRMRWEGDRALGYGRCQVQTKTGKPCTRYACGPHGKCRTHKRVKQYGK